MTDDQQRSLDEILTDHAQTTQEACLKALPHLPSGPSPERRLLETLLDASERYLASEGDEGLPQRARRFLVKAQVADGKGAVVLCPWCGEFHLHGMSHPPPIQHRQAHCEERPADFSPGYYVYTQTPETFAEYVEHRPRSDDPEGDFAQDWRDDQSKALDGPGPETWDQLSFYLRFRHHAPQAAIDAARLVWLEWQQIQHGWRYGPEWTG